MSANPTFPVYRIWTSALTGLLAGAIALAATAPVALAQDDLPLPGAPALRVEVCDAYDAPLVGAGWQIPDAKAPATLPPIESGLSMEVIRSRMRVSVDGRLNEPAWETPTVLNGLRYYDTGEFEPARSRTVVRFTYDDEAFYIGAICYDERIGRSAKAPEEIAAALRHDSLLFCIDPEADLSHPYLRYYQVSAVEALEPMFNLGDATPENAPWTRAVAFTTGQWSVEIRIPWWAMDPTPNFRNVMPVNVIRLRNNGGRNAPWTPFMPDRSAGGAATSAPPSEAGQSDPYTRNSAWALVGGMEGRNKERLARVGVRMDFTPFLWDVRDVHIEAIEGQGSHVMRGFLENHTQKAVTLLAMATSYSGAWRATRASREYVLEPGAETPIELVYSAPDPGRRRVLLSIHDQSRRKLRQSSAWSIFPNPRQDRIAVKMVQNERAHASLVLRPGEDIEQIALQVGDLQSDTGIYFGRNVPVRMLAPDRGEHEWRIDPTGRYAAIPLQERQTDFLTAITGAFDLAKDQPRRFLLTFSSQGLEPGVYKGHVAVLVENREVQQVPVELEIKAAMVLDSARPVFGVWKAWEGPTVTREETQALAERGVNLLSSDIQVNEMGGFGWTGADQALMETAHMRQIDLALTLPSRLLIAPDRREELLGFIDNERQRYSNARILFGLEDVPFGAGLHDIYSAIRRQSPWARTACVINARDESLINSTHLLDDWLISAGAAGIDAGKGPLGQILEDERFVSLFERSHFRNRYLIFDRVPNRSTPGETANSLRQTFWYAQRHGLDGVVTRFEDAGNALSRSLLIEALADGAEDYGLLQWYALQIQVLAARENLSRNDQAQLAQMRSALASAYVLIENVDQRNRFQEARLALYDGLLTPEALRLKQQQQAEALRQQGRR